jgi:hypothetical protein
MLEVNLVQLVDDDLAPILSRYQVLQRIIATGEVETEDVAIFLADVNARFTAVLDRIAS